MALILKDRVKETTITTGTSSFVLDGAVTGYQAFSAAIGDGNTTYYAVYLDGGSEWEVGIGTYSSSGDTLARTTILASSNSGSIVTFSAGTKQIWCDYPAGKAIYANASGNIESASLTSPKINEILDTNGNEVLGLSPTTSATDYLVVKNGIGVGVPLHIYADGSSTSIGLHIQPKGTGLVTISDGTDFNKGIRFRSSGSAASAVTLLDAVSTAGRVVTLPDATTTLVGRDTTDTLTNKSISGSTNTLSNIGNSSLTNSAITINGTSTSLGGSISVGTVTSVTGTAPVVSSGGATPAISMAAANTTTDGYLTSTDWNTFNGKGSGTVTSVGGTGTVNGITLTGTVTSSGNLTLGGALSGVSLTTQVSGVLPVANGGTNASIASITAFNNITGYTASGASGTTSTNLVFSTSPTITTATVTGVKETSVAVAASDIDLSLGNYFTKTISGNTTFTVSNVASSGTVNSFILQLTNGGSATVTYFTGVEWAGGTAPTLTTSGIDVLGFYTIDGGTNWYSFVLGKAMA